MTDTREHHRQRSEFIREIVQCSSGELPTNAKDSHRIPRTIVQFWHDLRDLPDDVKECIDSWARWTRTGFTHRLFDENSAAAFISSRLGPRHHQAFGRCYHPAMQADYFRLCYLAIDGGFYVDADDVCIGADIDWLFTDSRLKIQPLCYDVGSGTMVRPSVFRSADANSPEWIFYFNNNPLIADREHPIIMRALGRATDLIERAEDCVALEIQETTGPGNLSRSIFDWGSMRRSVDNELFVLREWESIAISKWPLSYRADARNWRHANQQAFRRELRDQE
ncbi:MAG: glycosyltransferase [Vicinamibacterales bacterium]